MNAKRLALPCRSRDMPHVTSRRVRHASCHARAFGAPLRMPPSHQLRSRATLQQTTSHSIPCHTAAGRHTRTHTHPHTHTRTHTHPRARVRIGHKLRIDTHAHTHASTRIRAHARAHTRTHPRRHNRARASHHRAGPNPQRCMARISDRRTVITIAATSARRNPAQIRGRTGTLRASRPMAQLAALDVGVHRRAQPRLRTAET